MCSKALKSKKGGSSREGREGTYFSDGSQRVPIAECDERGAVRKGILRSRRLKVRRKVGLVRRGKGGLTSPMVVTESPTLKETRE